MTIDDFIKEWRCATPTIEVKTSGSTGVPKQMRVEKARMTASARTTCAFLELHEGDSALLCMPLDYIAGKMMAVRAEVCGLHLTVVEPSNRPLMAFANTGKEFDFIAMVPSQVYETIRHEDEKEVLKHTRHLIIGGGAVSQELQNELQDFPHSVWSTYGMTETLSHIAMRKINGADASEWYSTLPGVEVETDENSCLVIRAPHVCPDTLHTNDIVELRNGRFRVLGRKDNVICSGGIKIQIEEVEALLSRHISTPFAITKRSDEKFGEAVVIVSEDSDLDAIKAVCHTHLPRYWQPKHYFHIAKIPLTETGKIARKQLADMIEAAKG